MATVTSTRVRAQIEEVLTYALENGAIKRKQDPTRVEFLRVSSLPFCPRQWFLGVPRSHSRSRYESVADSWFLYVGTLYHELIQQATSEVENRAHTPLDSDDKPLKLPHSGVIIQDWVCSECGHRHYFCPRPAECAHCGDTILFHHKEHQVNYRRILRGHMDGTVAFPIDDKPYSKDWIHVVLDYKTCSADKVKSGTGLPYADNEEQLLTYGALKSLDGYNVPGVALVYVSRDNPHRRRLCYTPLNQKAQMAKVDAYCDQFAHVRNVRSVEDAMALPSVVSTDFDTECSYCTFKQTCKQVEKGDTSTLRVHATSAVSFLKRRDTKPVFPS